MKRYELNEAAEGLIFWPQADVKAAYEAVGPETKDGGELAALRRFHRRMSFFLKTACPDTGMNLGDEAVAYAYEYPALERDLAAIRCGACPVLCPSADVPAPTPIMKQHIDCINEADGINSIEFSPAERVEEIFKRLQRSMNTPREAAELKVFALRMIRLYDNAEYSYTHLGEKESFKAYAEKEAAEDAEFVRGITGGAV